MAVIIFRGTPVTVQGPKLRGVAYTPNGDIEITMQEIVYSDGSKKLADSREIEASPLETPAERATRGAAEFETEAEQDAYHKGFNSGHGVACHNVPKLGSRVRTEDLGTVTVTAENIREIHQSECYSAESHSRDYSPFEFTANELNSSDDSEELWSAYEQGVSDAITHDLAQYSDEDYGIDVAAAEDHLDDLCDRANAYRAPD